MEEPKITFPGSVFGPVRLIACLATLSCLAAAGQGAGTPMHKVQLTQKGYIQFLRWELPVPRLTEFTFCLWLESVDLTHPHSIFSYSKNEKDRLVRAWISPHGRSVHLEIGGTQVFAAAADIRENRWYHVCQSWENQAGRYAMWINGQLWVHGRSEKTAGHVIPRGGDIVVGQEYTDFDKGLEDGIEGSVLGFNLLLASAFDPHEAPHESIAPPSASSYATVPIFARIPPRAVQRSVDHGRRPVYAFAPNQRRRVRRYREDPRPDVATFAQPRQARDPLGLQLVKLSYVRCEIGRGSPYIGGPLMLISWSRTAVRVFGGAVIKNAKSDCGRF
ncbi:C-reactive protein 1.4 [Andrena cerasifolii]|uniref:C-reactive protein 1.4 n=1 Tax=Andrena cerasifolii TaxID=2819439 RepID=UPI0040377AEA